MDLELSGLRGSERTALLLRSHLEKRDFRKYRMGRFEEYSLYQQYASFLGSDQVITFTDLDGRLLAVKPDVTLSIAKNAMPAPGECKKYYYQENVYRPSRESHTFTEITQMGAECIGAVNAETVTEVLRLAADALALTGGEFVLELGHMGFVTGLLEAIRAPAGLRRRLLECIRDKKAHQVAEYAAQGRISRDAAAAIVRVMQLSGEPNMVLAQAGAMVLNTRMSAALDELRLLGRDMGHLSDRVRISLNLVGEMDYYNGVVLAGYVKGLHRCVLKGGRYDLLAGQFTRGAGAIGFAVYLDELEQLDSLPAAERMPGSTVLNVALPKGRLSDAVLELLANLGYASPEEDRSGRKLVLEDRDAGIRYFLVKPSDVAAYVEHGAADVGIVGKDILEETGADVYELLDTGLGRCRMCVAARAGFTDDESRPLRVATKFVNIAKRYFAAKGRAIDIIKLNGSIELAPLLGLSDVIVDIVETGTTLRENGLAVLEEFMPVSARLIANKSTSKFKEEQLRGLLDALREGIRT